jgi:hypothetical protein
MPATYDDANLVVQLLSWATQLNLPEAVSIVLGESYDPEVATADDPPVRTLLMFGEVVGTLVKQDVLDRVLVLDLWWFEGLWRKVGSAATRERQRLEENRLYENFEALAAAK